jgi:hypothetical protein
MLFELWSWYETTCLAFTHHADAGRLFSQGPDPDQFTIADHGGQFDAATPAHSHSRSPGVAHHHRAQRHTLAAYALE